LAPDSRGEILARYRLLGVFEDAAQRDFHLGLVSHWAHRHEIEVEIESRLTHGCHFGNLAEFLSEASKYSGVIVAVDGKKEREASTIKALTLGLTRFEIEISQSVLWSVALPCVEEWMAHLEIAT